jgi:hypothetical protein
MAPIPTRFPGMGPIRGYSDPEPWATAEEVHGYPANSFHGQWGEQAQPYSWQSQLTNYTGEHGPYGLENGLLGDEDELGGEPAGLLGSDPYADETPYRGHAAPMTKTLSGPLPSQYDAINEQLVPAAEIRSTDLGASRKFTLTELGDAQQDQWHEIYDVDQGDDKYPAGQRWAGAISVFGFGNNDRTVNAFRKQNQFGFDMGHHHRRYAVGSIPGNYQWMMGKSRPLVKSLPGPARPAVGKNSPFENDDLGTTFGIQGAVLMEVPSEYQPPPTPQMVQPVNYDEPAPTVDLW